MPTAPPPPVLFTTTIFWPSAGSASSASMRSEMSVPPPAAVGITISIGRDGYFSCAVAQIATIEIASAALTRFIVRQSRGISPPWFIEHYESA